MEEVHKQSADGYASQRFDRGHSLSATHLHLNICTAECVCGGEGVMGNISQHMFGAGKAKQRLALCLGQPWNRGILSKSGKTPWGSFFRSMQSERTEFNAKLKMQVINPRLTMHYVWHLHLIDRS